MRVRLESKQGMADRMLEGSLPALSDVVQRTVDRLSSDKQRVATELNRIDDPNGPVTNIDESFTPIMDRCAHGPWFRNLLNLVTSSPPSAVRVTERFAECWRGAERTWRWIRASAA